MTMMTINADAQVEMTQAEDRKLHFHLEWPNGTYGVIGEACIHIMVCLALGIQGAALVFLTSIT